jgi:hypothetical protein
MSGRQDVRLAKYLFGRVASASSRDGVWRRKQPWAIGKPQKAGATTVADCARRRPMRFANEVRLTWGVCLTHPFGHGLGALLSLRIGGRGGLNLLTRR